MSNLSAIMDVDRKRLPTPFTLEEARVYCRRFTKSHYENFTVASWLLPRHLRQHFANIYSYCRTADDLADETGDAKRSLELLDEWESQLRDCYAGRTLHPVFVALAETIAEFEIPIEPFADLLVAFRQDQRVARYESFDQLHEYCRYSANPVGRLVLHLGRCRNDQTTPLSDSICTGLQLVNCWQDVSRDWKDQRRVYLPAETMRRFNCDEDAPARGFANAAFRDALKHEVTRAETYLNNGWPLVDLVSSELRIDIELFLRGGLAVAAAIRQQDYDVLTNRPVVNRLTKLQLLAKAIWRGRVGKI